MIARNRYFYKRDYKNLAQLYTRRLCGFSQDLGVATGTCWRVFKPAFGVGVDISAKMIAEAKARYPQYVFIEGDVEQGDWLAEAAGRPLLAQ